MWKGAASAPVHPVKVNKKLETTEPVARRCSVKEIVLKNFTNFSGKNLCRSLFLIKLQDYSKNIARKMWQEIKLKIVHSDLVHW